MRSKAIALASALGACLAAGPGMAQEQAAVASLTAEQMIEVERELYGSPDLREPCARPNPGEIVVCHTEPEDFRVESPTEAALRNGERPPGMPPNAAHLFDPPPCVPSLLTFCGKFGRAPKAPAIVDLTALPEPLTAEEAALVFRADDWPAEAGPARPAAASPADAP